jgi:nucleotide-binding universal stress UspA family protein
MKILIAFDQSPYSMAALHSVLARPWPAGSKFKILSVLEPFHPEYAGWQTAYTPVAIDSQKAIEEAAVKLIGDAEKSLAEVFGAENVIGEVTEGYIKERLLDDAKNWDADLIVLGSHGRRGFTKFLLGSVSEAIAAHATCSVEIVRIKERPQAASEPVSPPTPES